MSRGILSDLRLDKRCYHTEKAKHTTSTPITRMLTEEELPEKSEYIYSVGKVDIFPASRALTVAEVNMLITPEVTNIFQNC